MTRGEKFIDELKMLRKGEPVKCSECGEGYMVTKFDPETSHFFYCDKCGVKLNID